MRIWTDMSIIVVKSKSYWGGYKSGYPGDIQLLKSLKLL